MLAKDSICGGFRPCCIAGSSYRWHSVPFGLKVWNMPMTNEKRHVFCLFMLLVLALPGCNAGLQYKEGNLPASGMIESSDLRDVQSQAEHLARLAGKDEVLLVYDLDNTLLAMQQELGSDQWYYWQKDLQKVDRCDSRLVTDLLAAQGALFHISAMRPTQDDAAQLVSSMQKQGFKSIILTSRGPEFAASSFRELRRNQLDFSHSAIGTGSGQILEFKPASDARLTRYENGVYFTAGQHKGQMLLALLKQTGTAVPRAIVMADDKADNLQHVLDAFADQPVSVQALRYNREDAQIAVFDGDQTVKEWRLAEPALLQLQALFGSHNYDLPEPAVPAGCPAAQP